MLLLLFEIQESLDGIPKTKENSFMIGKNKSLVCVAMTLIILQDTLYDLTGKHVQMCDKY